MKEIGGFFELELRTGNEYHSNSIKLNSARNALEYILRSQKITKVYLPYYACGVLMEPFNRLCVEVEYYSINDRLEINDEIVLHDDEKLLYINYFDLKEKYIKDLIRNFSASKLIIDNAQSFFSMPFTHVDTIYSPRKYFGIPDGGYLYSDFLLSEPLERDSSIDRFQHLLGRMDFSASDYYDKFKKNDANLSHIPLKRMSTITEHLLKSIDYDYIADVRISNWKALHERLKDENRLLFKLKYNNVPFMYPFLNNGQIKQILIQNKIYIPTLWNEVLANVPENSHEYNFVDNLILLPIDQRYSVKEMDIISEIILKEVQSDLL